MSNIKAIKIKSQMFETKYVSKINYIDYKQRPFERIILKRSLIILMYKHMQAKK